MEIVFNDYSLTAQFETDEDFIDSLIEYTFPLLEILKNCSSIVLKKYDTYNLKVTTKLSLYDLLTKNKYRGYSEFQKLRTLLADLTDTPYWEEQPKTNVLSVYSTEYTGCFSGCTPNCFSEAYERDNIILSIENEHFKNNTVAIEIDNRMDYINNFYNIDSSAEVLFQKGHLSFSELLHCINNGVDISFYTHNKSVYIDKEFSDEKFSSEDISKIIQCFRNWVLGITTDSMISHLTDSISYKDMSYNEIRITLDNKREFRIFYKLFGNEYVFFNLLLKDTPSTPLHIKKKTFNLIKNFIEK